MVIAIPVYTKLPDDMKNFINRFCPIMNPELRMLEGRTRAKLRDEVNIKKIVLISICGWWEMGNFETVEKIMQELSKTTNVEFTGALLRRHSYAMTALVSLQKLAKMYLSSARKQVTN
ncbi:MAG: hypothetical protein ACP5D6_08595 [Kosmotogaceae bacterium]